MNDQFSDISKGSITQSEVNQSHRTVILQPSGNLSDLDDIADIGIIGYDKTPLKKEP